MKKSWLILVAILILASVLVGGFFMWKRNASTIEPIIVTIKDFSFSPETLVLKTGGAPTTVTWDNEDAVIHDVTMDNGLFDKDINPGESFSYTFTEAGTYDYHCDIHTSMKGKIIVE